MYQLGEIVHIIKPAKECTCGRTEPKITVHKLSVQMGPDGKPIVKFTGERNGITMTRQPVNGQFGDQFLSDLKPEIDSALRSYADYWGVSPQEQLNSTH